jgi:hypothetical protein
MSSDAAKAESIAKADTIAYRFYTKLVLVVADARAPSANPAVAGSSGAPKVDKWVGRYPVGLLIVKLTNTQ